MKFKLGDVVNVKENSKEGYSARKKVTIYCIQYARGLSGKILYKCLNDVTSVAALENDISLVKTQTLLAYKDSTDEVHWSTRKYNKDELKNFGFTEAKEFNKTIDLE